MIIIGIILMVVGMSACAVGAEMNSNLEMQLESLFETGSADPGMPYVMIGSTLFLVGFVLLIVGCVNHGKKKQVYVQTPVYINPMQTPAAQPAPSQFCVKCGSSLPANSKVCNQCGHSLSSPAPQPVQQEPVQEIEVQQEPVQAPAPQPSATRYCTNCGASLLANAKFCSACGQVQGSAPQQASVQADAAPAEATADQPSEQ